MMTRSMLLSVLVASSLRVCGAKAPAPAAVASADGPLPVALHGGVMAARGGVVAEVNTLPDGRLVAYVQDAARAPLPSATVQVALQKPGGVTQSVPLAYDNGLQAYVGRPTQMAPGAYPAQVTVRPNVSAPAVQLVTPAVQISMTAPLPRSRHGGQVEIVGDNAVEMVTAPSGEVSMYWMDPSGVPIPASEVTAPTVTIDVAGQPLLQVPTRREGARLVAQLSMPGAPLPPVVGMGVPTVTIRGVPYRGVSLVAGVQVAADALPLPAPPFVVVNGPPPPAVVMIAPPAPDPNVEIVPSQPPGIVVMPPPPPGVVIAPPPVPSVVFAPPPQVVVRSPGVSVQVEAPVFGFGAVGGRRGQGHGDGDDDHGHGHGGDDRGDDHDRGRGWGHGGGGDDDHDHGHGGGDHHGR